MFADPVAFSDYCLVVHPVQNCSVVFDSVDRLQINELTIHSACLHLIISDYQVILLAFRRDPLRPLVQLFYGFCHEIEVIHVSAVFFNAEDGLDELIQLIRKVDSDCLTDGTSYANAFPEHLATVASRRKGIIDAVINSFVDGFKFFIAQ